MKKYASFAIAVLISIPAFCCEQHQSENPGINLQTTLTPVEKQDSNYIHLYVNPDGFIYINFKPSTLQDLEVSLKKLKASGGSVHYLHDNIRKDTKREAPVEAIQALEMVNKYQLPIKYIDAVLPKSK